jgi:hypothetical protein
MGFFKLAGYRGDVWPGSAVSRQRKDKCLAQRREDAKTQKNISIIFAPLRPCAFAMGFFKLAGYRGDVRPDQRSADSEKQMLSAKARRRKDAKVQK